MLYTKKDQELQKENDPGTQCPPMVYRVKVSNSKSTQSTMCNEGCVETRGVINILPDQMLLY